MVDPVRELKIRAELLHRAIHGSEVAALERLRVLAEFRRAEEADVRAAATSIQRKHCLWVVARELGFASWEHAKRVLEGNASEPDFGTLLYGLTDGGHLNHWFASYAEARAFLDERSSATLRFYLLAYKRHFFVTERHFIETLGLAADDPDWAAIGWDWARPRLPEARRRLYGKLLTARRPLGAESNSPSTHE